MAAKYTSLEDDLCCPVCYEIYTDPVVLTCSHSFCRACLQQCWEKMSSQECPVCRRKSYLLKPPANLALRNIVESYSKQKSKTGSSQNREGPQKIEAHCRNHGEKLLLFCEDDQEPICVLCQTSNSHKNHKICPVDEAALALKERLKSNLNLLKEKLKRFNKDKQDFQKTVKHIKNQSQLTERQIKNEFEKLHQFLNDEEEARLAALKEEEENKSQMMMKKIEKISEFISTLSDNIRDIEKVIAVEDISFLKMYRNSTTRAQVTMQDPEPVSGTLIDVAKHLCSLRFRVWEKMLRIVQYTPVTLDPNTARASLSVSDDLTSVRDTGLEQQLPDNPERFSKYVNVLGSEGFNSGKHSWEVEVGNTPQWDIGVAEESVNRKGDITLSPENGFWVLFLRNGDEYGVGTRPWSRLTLEKKPQRIRVQLDYDKGYVSFYNSSDVSHIYTFRHTFTETLYPYFSPHVNKDGSNHEALKICPVKLSVMMM